MKKNLLFSILASICVSGAFAQSYPNDYSLFVPYNRMSNSTNGNIGIGFGFNSPQSLLHVNGDIQANGLLRTNNGTDFLRFGTNDASGYSFLQFGDDATDQLHFQHATYQNGNLVMDRDVMTISGYGMVGIGTSSPSNALTINTDISTGFQLNGTASDYTGITVNSTSSPRYSYSYQGFEVVRQEYDANRNWNLAVRAYGSNFFKNAITVNESGKVSIPNLELKSPLIVNGDAPDAVIGANVNNTTGVSKYSLMRNNVEQAAISYSATGGLYFTTRNSANVFNTAIAISPDGNVGIGTPLHTDLAGGFKLSVKGKMVSEQAWVLVEQDWPDYVFNDDYKLPSLDEVKSYVKTNHHLPEVPAAETIEASGVNMGAMHVTMMKKIEELTLYLIAVKDELESVKKEVTSLREENKKLTGSISH